VFPKQCYGSILKRVRSSSAHRERILDAASQLIEHGTAGYRGRGNFFNWTLVQRQNLPIADLSPKPGHQCSAGPYLVTQTDSVVGELMPFWASCRGHGQHRTGRASHHALGNTAAHRINHSMPAFSRHDDQVCIVSRLEDCRRNIASTSQFLP